MYIVFFFLAIAEHHIFHKTTLFLHQMQSTVLFNSVVAVNSCGQDCYIMCFLVLCDNVIACLKQTQTRVFVLTFLSQAFRQSSKEYEVVREKYASQRKDIEEGLSK